MDERLVLVVEPDQVLGRALCAALGHYGCRCSLVADAAEAQRALGDRPVEGVVVHFGGDGWEGLWLGDEFRRLAGPRGLPVFVLGPRVLARAAADLGLNIEPVVVPDQLACLGPRLAARFVRGNAAPADDRLRAEHGPRRPHHPLAEVVGLATAAGRRLARALFADARHPTAGPVDAHGGQGSR